MNLEEFFAVYPSWSDNVQEIISSKKEFVDLEPLRYDIPGGGYFKHQELVGRLMMFLDHLMLIHGTGSGKTCGMARISEYFRKNPGRIRHTYVLTPNETLAKNFRNELVNKCPTDYLTPEVEAKIGRGREILLTKKIRGWYTIMTFGSFASYFLGVEGGPEAMTRKDIVQQFSSSLFLVDEVHNLRSAVPPIDSGKDLTAEELGEELATRRERKRKRKPTKGDLEEEEEVKGKRDTQRVYDFLWRIFHEAPGVKVALATATPMVNSYKDIVPIMDLLLPEDRQLSRTQDLLDFSVEEFRPYFNGMISYVRESSIGVDVIYEGREVEVVLEGKPLGTSITVYPTVMSEFQEKWYLVYQGKEDPGAVYTEERQAAIFVFPDGSIGTRGFDKYVITDRIEYETKARTRSGARAKRVREIYRPTRELREALHPDNIWQYSCEFSGVGNLIADSEGLSYCFIEYVRVGAILLGFSLEERKFIRFDPDNPKATPGIRRYAILTSSVTPTQRDRIISTFNSEDNIKGDLIAVIIATEVVQEGVSFENVVNIHILTPDWHQSGNYQAISRAIRVTSQLRLLELERARLKAEGKDESEARVVVHVYNHAAISPQLQSSIQLLMYQTAAGKDIDIKTIFRVMKRYAVDCAIMKSRNIRQPPDKDYTPACDYTLCRYECIDGDIPEELDESTYHPLYSLDDSRSIFPVIKDVLQKRSSIDIDSLTKEVQAVRPEILPNVVLLSIYDIVTNGISVPDRFGVPRFVIMREKNVFLSPIFPNEQQSMRTFVYFTPLLKTYSDFCISLPGINFRSKVRQAFSDEQDRIVEELLVTPREDPRRDTLLMRLFLESEIKLVERALILDSMGKGTEIIEDIIDTYENSIFWMDEPTNLIEEVMFRLSQPRSGRGRIPKDPARIRANDPKLKGMDFTPTRTDIPVIIHTLYTWLYNPVAYDITTQAKQPKGKYRLFNLREFPEGTPIEDMHFRDINPYEKLVYTRLVHQQTAPRFSEFEGTDIYGTILNDGKFRIVDKTLQKQGVKQKNKKEERRGSICENWRLKNLYPLMYRIGIKMPDIDLSYLSRDELLDDIDARVPGVKDLELKSDEELEFILAWARVQKPRNEVRYLCEIIKEYLTDNNLIYTI